MAGLPLPLGSESQKIHERFCVIFEECIENNMSKAEILSYVHDKYLIPLHDTNREDFCQQVLNALGHIIKLLSDGHGLGPHPSATGSLKRKRVGENEERGENEEGEKLQENERGGNEEAEKQKEKEEGVNEGLQKKEEGNCEELQKKEEGEN
ncbi:BnaA02g25320D [Brassica napus]|uniref:BnaA02g25320D protein n=1 Tax=Brassica napus TaxID=3708 RepID=A0A078GUX9_BRANA|nr:BnaA02g25320D [Brassica napus]